MAHTEIALQKLREDGQMIEVDRWKEGDITYVIEAIKGKNESYYSWQRSDMVRIGWAVTTRLPNAIARRIQDLIRGDI